MIRNDVKVSIVTPTYNSEQFIKETIECVLNQTHQNFELLIVDDCSTDNTLEIIQSLNDKRIKIFKNYTNKGPAYCRNLAIKNASGDYIAFLDSDDIWLSEKLEKQLNFMIENDYSFSSCNYELVDENGNSLNKYVFSPKKVTHKDFLKSCYVGALTVIYKKDIYPNLEIPSDILKRNDYALWIKLSEKCDCYNLDMILAKYRKRHNSVSSIRKTRLFKFHITMYKKLYDYCYLKAFIYALRNVFYLFVRRNKYTKNIGDDI